MQITASANHQLDGLLEALCLELSLTESQHQRAARAYETLGDWLSAEGTSLAIYLPQIYPQGSLPLGTAVRPRSGEKFDADGICLLTRGATALTPDAVYKLVLARIREHALYAEKASPQDRCIRIEYENNFHLDIVPAIPADPVGTRILIPTADHLGWQSSDPKGFEQWFRARERVRVALNSIRADAEPMPLPVAPAKKSPLQRVVQLSKRRRDVYFDGNSEAGPKSILLTTLLASAYVGESLVTDATLRALTVIGARMPLSPPPRIENPSNPGENLARQWAESPRTYQAFLEFRSDFQGKMHRLLQLRGMEAIADALRELFDPNHMGFVDRAVQATTASFQNARSAGQVTMGSRTSVLSVGGTVGGVIAIPENTFYGE